MKYPLFTLFSFCFFLANGQVFSAFKPPLSPFFPYSAPNFNALEDGVNSESSVRPSLSVASGLTYTSPNLPYAATDLRFRWNNHPLRIGFFHQGIPQFSSLGFITGTGFSWGPQFFGAIDFVYRNLGIPEYETYHFKMLRISWAWNPKLPFSFRCQTALEAGPKGIRNSFVQAAIRYAISSNHSLALGFRNYSPDNSPETSLQFCGMGPENFQYVITVPLSQTGVSAGFGIPYRSKKIGFSADWTLHRGTSLHLQLILPLQAKQP